MNKRYYVYIIKCSGNRLYTGYTSDPEKRFNQHKTGKGGAKFTSGFKPLSIAALWEIEGTKGEAMKVEALIKTLKSEIKKKIISEPCLLSELVFERFPDISLTLSTLEVDITFEN